ncbi:MarR family winged helix-turn-helix transcriptional regulator [Cellulomonas sp. HZM]|uniref:MarR family winged helix-turn-helix transcriptional regulator n=1 Tax=Cellulomonas sp. HZM TaxID=1454010 RepID=UPI0004937023|nr:MarR family transcriptional regulator [Cellulomonas sp. HZM]
MRATPHFWYDDESVVPVLEALREFRRADADMRRRLSAGMEMNLTDVQAVRYVVATEQAGAPPSAADLARHLRISTASTTKLLDRLELSGHVVRRPHPTDGRAVVVCSTDHSHAEIRRRLTSMHAAMADAVRAVPEGARPALVDFLTTMAHVLDEQDVAPLEPAGGPRGATG